MNNFSLGISKSQLGSILLMEVCEIRNFIITSIERLGEMAAAWGDKGPDIRQTRKCVCYYT